MGKLRLWRPTAQELLAVIDKMDFSGKSVVKFVGWRNDLYRDDPTLERVSYKNAMVRGHMSDGSKNAICRHYTEAGRPMLGVMNYGIDGAPAWANDLATLVEEGEVNVSQFKLFLDACIRWEEWIHGLQLSEDEEADFDYDSMPEPKNWRLKMLAAADGSDYWFAPKYQAMLEEEEEEEEKEEGEKVS